MILPSCLVGLFVALRLFGGLDCGYGVRVALFVEWCFRLAYVGVLRLLCVVFDLV